MSDAPKIITGKNYGKALVEALDLGTAVSRVVIDCKVNDVVRVYVERFGDERLLDIIPPKTTVEIVTTDAVPKDEPES